MGAVMSVVLARLFMKAYPILSVEPVRAPRHWPAIEKWQSAMTFKFVGALDGLTHPESQRHDRPRARHRPRDRDRGAAQGHQGQRRLQGLGGVAAGSATTPTSGSTASCCRARTRRRFGGFVDFGTSAWFGGGSVVSSAAPDLPSNDSPSGPGGGTSRGHEHRLARRRRPDRRRLARRAGPRDLGAAPHGDVAGVAKSGIRSAPGVWFPGAFLFEVGERYSTTTTFVLADDPPERSRAK